MEPIAPQQAGDDAASTGRPRVEWLEWLVLGVVLCLFGALKLFGSGFHVGDENIYFYEADAMLRGLAPHRDFYHNHPPLHLHSLAWMFAATGGFSITAARVLPAVAAGLAAIFLFAALRPSGVVRAWLAAALFLLSFDVLRISTHPTGTNLAVMLCAIGFERMARGRDGQSALAFSLGCFTHMSAVPAAVGAGLVLLLCDSRRGLRFALTGVASVTLLNLTAVIALGPGYIDDVYWLHIGKQRLAGVNGPIFMGMFALNTWLVGGSAVGVLALLLRPASGSGGSEGPASEEKSDAFLAAMRYELSARLPIHAALGAALASLVFLVSIQRVFTYYFEVLLLCLAPVAAHGLVELVRSWRAAVGGRGAEAWVTTGILTIVFVASQAPALGLTQTGDRGDTTGTRHHVWRGSGLRPLDALARPLFRGGEERVGQRTLAWTHYLWHESEDFASAAELAEQVRRVCGEEETLFGDSTATPLIALLAGRRVALDEPDTNHMRFGEHAISPAAFIERLERDPPCVVVYRPRHGLFMIDAFQRWRDRHYVLFYEAEDRGRPWTHQLFERRRPAAEDAEVNRERGDEDGR